ncbi:MAG: 1-acyl-sn-glycerol-3-phosphate acyltransferase [Chloroflexales bacterium]|nr:1-acyl-sn-glycerol-3-phosphate acyltransferase [Chloroflexales bacterium]
MFGVLFYGFLYILIHTMIAIGWWRWRVEGRENLPPRQNGGMIVVMNHVHWLDIPAVGALLPFSYRLSWLGKIEIFAHPIIGWFFRAMNVIPIKRGQRDLAALDASVEALKDGAVLLIFPEGTRNRSGVLREGRGGAIRLAISSGAPIVPMAMTGTMHGLRGTFRREPLMLKIGKPYIIKPLPNGKIPFDTMERLKTDMMIRIAQLLPEERRGFYKQLAASDTKVL